MNRYAPYAILLIPVEGCAARLLGDGRCGARPPCVTDYSDGWRIGMLPAAAGWPTHALPLWWDGALVPEGWDRVLRAFGWHDWPRDPTQHGGAAYVLRMLEVEHEAVSAICRVVALDLVDGQLVERVP